MPAGVKKGTHRGKYISREERLRNFKNKSKQEIEEMLESSSSVSDLVYKVFKTKRGFEEIQPILKSHGLTVEILRMRAKKSEKLQISWERIKERRREEFLKKYDKIFCENSQYDGKSARKFFSRYNPYFQWLEYKCEECGNTGEHNGKPLTLQLDHRNGENRDHRIENFRYLCPNCHSQTDTFCWKNVHRKRKLKKLMEDPPGHDPGTLD